MKKNVEKATKSKTAAAAPKKAVVKKTAVVKKSAAPEPLATKKKSSVAPAVKTKGKPKSGGVTTTIVAAIDVGFGNRLVLRGEGPGLSWDLGATMECVGDDRWSITLAETSRPIVCKFLVNDAVWSAGEDYTVLPGSNVVLSPTF
jgi:hypothetical protein